VSRPLIVSGALFSLVALVALAPALPAQALRASDYLLPQQLPRAVQPYQQVLGDRLRVPGRERVISLGTVTDARGTSPAVLSWELPGRLRFERSSTGDRVIQAGAAGLATTAIQATLNEAEENLVDSLLHDRIETFLLNAAQGQSVRLIAQNVRGLKDKSRDYAGPLYDVYDQVAKVDSRASSPQRLKRFFIDARTGQLHRVVYYVNRGGKLVQAETIFTQWTLIQGQAIPQTIERRHDGVNVFTYRSTATSFAAFALDNLFERP